MADGIKGSLAVAGAVIGIAVCSTGVSMIRDPSSADLQREFAAVAGYTVETVCTEEISLPEEQSAVVPAETAISAVASASAETTVTSSVKTGGDPPGPAEPRSTSTVYASKSGIYHTEQDCSGMKYFTETDIYDVQAQGFRPCSNCCDTIVAAEAVQEQSVSLPADNTVYVSATGKYHCRSDCSGMKQYTEMSQSEAELAGHVACKRCY